MTTHTSKNTLSTTWRRWQRLAHRAAQVQSEVLLTLLYFLALVPIALLRRPFASGLDTGSPRWTPRPGVDRDIASARRQF